jgi:hypothetical protein
MGNVYFDLTEEFNRKGIIAVLTSGQAVVYYRTALMSKDGDWILDPKPEACAHVLDVLGGRGARYRPGAPLDVRWLAGGWSSHLEFHDEKDRRVRCDFLARPPRLDPDVVRRLFREKRPSGGLEVIDLESLILMKRTQRAKDYAVIGELARLLPPHREILYTTDPDRVLELAPPHGSGVDRPSVKAALGGGTRAAVVVALALETDTFQEADRQRLERYERVGSVYLERLVRGDLLSIPAAEAHSRIVTLAEEFLPFHPGQPDEGGAHP